MTHNSTYEYLSKENINTNLKIYMKINVYMKKIYTCSPVFTATLFTITKVWKQAKYLSMDE